MTDIIRKAMPHACEEFKPVLTGKETPEQIFQLFLTEPQVQEYCYKFNYPSLEQLRPLAPIARPLGIFIDADISLTNQRHIFAFGESTLHLQYTGYNVGIVHARHATLVEIDKAPTAVVIVYLYDDADIHSEQLQDTNLKVLRK